MQGEDIVVKNLIACRQFPESLAKRYAKILVSRWIKRGMEHDLDTELISEDIYQKTEDWKTPDYIPCDVDKIVKTELPFPNLNFAEQEIKEWIKYEKKIIEETKES